MDIFLVFTGFSCGCIGFIGGYIYGKERKKKEIKDKVNAEKHFGTRTEVRGRRWK